MKVTFSYAVDAFPGVAQLGRSIARALQINEDLVEAISLAHDLGHTPFGHAGQDALNECMKPLVGLSTTCRVCGWSIAWKRYPAYDGLNLTFETRRASSSIALCKMRSAWKGKSRMAWDGGLHKQQPSLEAQLCNLADEIAYNARY
jgi:dGTPase